jgi:hypothetical protein
MSEWFSRLRFGGSRYLKIGEHDIDVINSSRAVSREDFITSCRRESFKSHMILMVS